MWTPTIFLKFPDEQTALENLAILDESAAIDLIGKLARPTGDTGLDEMGNKHPIWEEIPGYHANIRLRDGQALPVELQPFVLEAPAYPKRVFA